jgi:VWFA-related protein
MDPHEDKLLDTMDVGVSSVPWQSQDGIDAMLQFKADLTAFQADQRVRITLEAMEELARYLGAIPGRKNLIWFSGSFPLVLDPDSAQRSPFQAMRNYSGQMAEASALLAAARVAVYPVDARGLLTMASADASNVSTAELEAASSGIKTKGVMNVAVAQPSLERDDRDELRELQTSQAGIRQIAAQTGGQAVINSNGLKEAVAQAIENGSSYYTIGYVPAAGGFRGEFRKLQVRLDNGDCQLAYRLGYYADPPEKARAATKPMAQAVVRGAPPATQILFQARVLPATDPLFQGIALQDGMAGEQASKLKKPVQRTVVDLIVDTRNLALAEMPDGTHHDQIELVLVAYDGEGRRVNYLDKSYNLAIKPEQFENTLANGIRLRMALDLPVGQFALRIAVDDVNGGRTGSLEVPLTIASR